VTNSTLRCRSVTVRYGSTPVLDGLDLELVGSETVALLGPSGSGKTTLLYAIAGLLDPDHGEIAIAGTVVAGPGVSIPPESRAVGMVFQNYALWPHLNAIDTIAYPMLRQGLSRSEARLKAERLLRLVGISDLADRLPDQLSGGQQQRVGLARALATEPALYLFDEPTAHLDAGLRTALQQELVEQRRRSGAAALYTTHDASEALAVADRVAVLRSGQIVQIASPEHIYREPVDVWTAGLTGPTSILSCVLVGSSEGTIDIEFAGSVSRIEGGSSCPPGPATLVVRPEWAALDGDRSGIVEHLTFEGAHTDYTIGTGHGSIRIRRAGSPRLQVGETTQWSLQRGWVLAASAEVYGSYPERMLYEHTQKSPLWLFVAVPIVVVVTVVAVAEGDVIVTLLAVLGSVVFIAFIAHFSWLTVTVEPAEALAAFGRGWPRKTVDLSRVTEVRAVRNRWLYGFGIRWVPKGSLWNVWGLDAVEFALDSGRVVRFGTDESDRLLAAVSGLIRTV